MKSKIVGFISGALYYPAAVLASDYNSRMIDYHLILNSDDSISGRTVETSGRLTLNDDARSHNIQIHSGGVMEINKNALDESSVVLAGGVQHVAGTALNTLIFGEQKVSGTVSDTVINGGYQAVYGSGRATGTTLSNGGTQYVTGIAERTIIESGNQYIQFGGRASNTIINDGGVQNVDGGTVTNTTIRYGGEMYMQGGSASNTIVDGGLMDVGGESTTVTNTVVTNDGGLYAIQGHVTDTVINRGEMAVYYQASASGIIINDGGRLISRAFVTDTTVNSGGVQYVNEGSSSNITVNEGGALYLNEGRVENVALSGPNARFLIATDKYTNHYRTPTLSGVVTASDRGQIVLGYDADASGADITLNSGASLQLLNNSALCRTDCLYTLNSLTLAGGHVALYNMSPGAVAGWNTLALSSLSGNGDFYMHTEVAKGKGDILNVTGNATGAFRLFVQDSGVSPSSDDSLLLVKTGGGDAVFTLGNNGGVVELGTWEYRLKENGGGNWLLSPDQKPASQPDPAPQPELPVENVKRRISASTAAVLNMAAVQPLVFDAELDSVRERLASGKMDGRDGALWMEQLNTRNNVATSAGADFEQRLSGLVIGMDRYSQREKSADILGAFFSYSHSNVGFARGGEGNVDSFSLGTYAGLQHDNGIYLDGIAKVNLFKNGVKGRMNSGGAADGNYRTYGAGTHLESGIRLSKNSWNLTPYMALSGFVGSDREYSLSNGMRADVDNTRMLRAEAGLGVDYPLTLDNGVKLQPWLKVSVRQALVDDNQITINDSDRFQNDLSGTRGVYQAGIRANITENLTGHLSAGYGDGAGVRSPWRAAAGVSWSF
ncbi:autotransporter outer membrane beta-barrel domain-containing protein [[Enterobacter] lignolyticus]|uniref:Outer membrane autotransporter barrel domain protein n=1 Tax=Enterobacter lignolyticus (strain SCF1) TaxID=701347 RepID=E3G2B5_ENTLS|nr:autotransporter outer membrane beta-barrel domain-containing protein [[Enterobacter] lignolyticus]ADO50332.1 outer membrane autotransporter barrel domain protein [[Enterobacter] lignolyticus SCF1]